MMRAKGKLVALRKSKKLTEEERRARALERAKGKLGLDETNRIQKLFQSLNVVGNNSRSVLDGVIMSLLQRNLSHNQIRAVTGIGGPRIDRVIRVMKNPSLLNKNRPKPVHAVITEDLNNIKMNLQT